VALVIHPCLGEGGARLLEFGLGGLDVKAVWLRVQRRQHLLRPQIANKSNWA
jgi:hypothetical protein